MWSKLTCSRRSAAASSELVFEQGRVQVLIQRYHSRSQRLGRPSSPSSATSCLTCASYSRTKGWEKANVRISLQFHGHTPSGSSPRTSLELE
jgi:hypothetical protein